jgi:hypothetical protein
MKNFIEDSAESIMLNSMSNVFVTEKLDPVGQEDADIDNDGDSDSSDSYLRKRRKAVGAAIAADKAKRVKKEEMELTLRQKVEGLSEKKLYKSEKATTSDEKETEITEKGVKNKVVINPDIAEDCWDGYEKKGMKTMFGKRYPNCVKKKTKKEEVELEEGIGDKLKSAAKAVKKGIEQENKLQRASGETLDRMKRMTRHKQDKYGPSTLKQRLKTGADHDIDAEKKAKGLKEGNKSGDSSLHDWFSKSKSSDGKPGWVQLGGKYAGKPCAKQPGQTTKPKCGSSKMKRDLNKDEEERAFRRKNAKDPNPDRKGKAINVKTEETINERGDFWHPDPDKDRKLGGPGANQRAREDRGAKAGTRGTSSNDKKLRPGESYMQYAKRMKNRRESVEIEEGKKDACYHKVKSRYSVWPSAYASGALVKCRKAGAKNWGNKSKKEEFEGRKTYQQFVDECWKTHKKVGMKMKGGKLVPDCRPKNEEVTNEAAAWTRKAGKSKEGGLNEKGRKSYERENPGSDLKAPSKKVGNPRRASFCARMKGMKKKLTSSKTAKDPDSRINKSLRAWNC